ncbi:MAG: nucleoside triphosphate pyrophosphohydrolase family protein [archaeon]
MDLKEYQELAKLTAKKDFQTKEEEIMCWGLGITGEAGDIASCIKKTFIHKKDVKEGIKENIGDMMWYTAMICNFFGWSLDDLLKENIEKLKKRFPEGFNYGSVNRDMVKWSGTKEIQK